MTNTRQLVGPRIALVTGSAKKTGIGAATALSLASEGITVVVADVANQGVANVGETDSHAGGPGWLGLESLVREIVEAGGAASMVIGDVSQEEDARRMVKHAVESYGRLDILVNVAAAPRGPESGDIEEITVSAWDQTMAINARGAFLMSREAVRPMRAQRWGRIVHLSSEVALKGGSNRVAYAASKAAVMGFTRALSFDVAAWGITVNAVAPGWVATSRVLSFVQGGGVDDVDDEIARKGQSLLLRRLGRPADVAGMIVFLVSDAAEWITGQTIVVDGGGLATADAFASPSP